MPTGCRPALRSGASVASIISRRAATRITSIVGPDSSVAGGAADDPVVEDRLVERHRNLLLGLEADGGLLLGGVVDRGQPQRPHDDALVGDPEPDPAARACGGEEGAEGVRERLGVGHLAVAEGAVRQLADGDLAELPGLSLHLGGGDAVAGDLEADDGLRLFRSELHPAQHRRDRATP